MIAGWKTRKAAATKRITFLLVILAGCLACRAGFGQVNSNTATVSLNATLAESLSVSVSPSTVSFNLVAGGTAVGNVPVAITTTWILSSTRAAITLDGSFGTATAALTGSSLPTVSIPTLAVYGLMSTGLPVTFTAFTVDTALGTVGAGLPLFIQVLTSTNRNASRTDNLTLEINLTTLPQLPAASNYTGSLFLQAQAL